MTLSVGQVQALTTKGIQAKGGVVDLVFKNNAYLERLRAKQGVYSGEKLSFPFNYKASDDTNGSFYVGGATLNTNEYDPYSELTFDLKEVQETLVITKRDLARNSGKEARLKLIEQRLKSMKQAMSERMTKGIFSDGTAATGAMTVDQFIGIQAFLLNSGVNYGGVLSSDVAAHVAYVSSNSGVARALTTALDQLVLGGATEGNMKPTLRIMRQNVMDQFVELLKPYQRTTREDNLDGLGHGKNTLVYSGVDSIIDNLAPAQSIAYINEEFVKLYVHPEFDMVVMEKDGLETKDAILNRVFLKGVFACNALRYQGFLKDIQVAS